MDTLHIDLTGIVLILVGAMAAYAIHKRRNLIEPITGGAIVVTLVVLLGQADTQPEPPSPGNRLPACSTAECPLGETPSTASR